MNAQTEVELAEFKTTRTQAALPSEKDPQTSSCPYTTSVDVSALVVLPLVGPTPGHRLAVRSLHDAQGALVTAIALDMPRLLDQIGTEQLEAVLDGVRTRLIDSFNL